MKKCPSVGDTVRYDGGLIVGPCTGVVTAIWPTYKWDEQRECEGDLEPEREWHVSVRPHVLPDKWGYVDSDKFAPAVHELRRA